VAAEEPGLHGNGQPRPAADLRRLATIGVVRHSRGAGRHDVPRRQTLSSRAVCIRDGGAEFDLLTAPDFNLFGVVVDRLAFADYLDRTARQDLDRLLLQGDVRNLAPGRKESLCATLARVLADAHHPDFPDAEALQERIFSALADALLSHDTVPVPTRRTRLIHQATVDRVRQYVLDNPEHPPTIPELCAHLHLSRRALQNCFEDVTGMPPGLHAQPAPQRGPP
jgi:AraC family ethanolamine operon transcriptional activator